MEADGVHDDHDQDAAEDTVFAHHQVEARVQHDGLAGHHGVPSDRDDGHGEEVVVGELEELEQETEGVEDAAIAGDNQRPEVEASMSLEGHEHLDVQLDDVEPRHRGEGGDGHVGGDIEGDEVAILAVAGRRRAVGACHGAGHGVPPHRRYSDFRVRR